MSTLEGQVRHLRRAWLVATEKMARTAGVYRLLDWLVKVLG